MIAETHMAHGEMWLRDIIARMRHDGCSGRPGKVELVTGIEGASSRPVRRIDLLDGCPSTLPQPPLRFRGDQPCPAVQRMSARASMIGDGAGERSAVIAITRPHPLRREFTHNCIDSYEMPESRRAPAW